MAKERQGYNSNEMPRKISLPALLPNTLSVLHRTQNTVGLLHDVIKESSSSYWYEKGKKANLRNDWQEASYALEKCLKLDAENWPAMLQLAVALSYQQGQLSGIEGLTAFLNITRFILAAFEAINAYEADWGKFNDELTTIHWDHLQEILDSSNLFQSLLAQAIVERVLGLRYGFGYRTLKSVKTTWPEHATGSALYYRIKGFLLYNNFKYKKAISQYNKAIANDSTRAISYLERGYLKERLNDHVGAIEDFDRAIKISPYNTTSYLQRSNSNCSLEAYADAIADCEKCLALNPDCASAYWSIGEIWHGLSEYVFAVNSYDMAIFLESSNVEYLLKRADVKLQNLDDKKAALIDYSHVIALDHQNTSAYSNRADIKEYLLDFYGALEDLDILLELEADSHCNFCKRSKIKILIQDYTGALLDCETAVTLLSGDMNKATDSLFSSFFKSYRERILIDYYHQRAKIKFLSGNFIGALSDYDQVILKDPKRIYVFRYRGDTNYAMKDYASAIIDYGHVINKEPSLAFILHKRGQAKYKSGDKYGALADFNRGIARDPHEAFPYLLRAKVKEDIGDKSGAADDREIFAMF